MRRRSPRETPEKIRHDVYIRQRSRQGKRGKRDETNRPLLPGRTNVYINLTRRQLPKVKHRTASTCPEHRPPGAPADRSTSETSVTPTTVTRSPTVTARDETEPAESSTSSSSRKTKAVRRTSRRKKRSFRNHMVVKKVEEDDDTPPSFATTQTSTSHQLTKSDRSAMTNVLLTQEDSQTSSLSTVEGQVRFYETNMQKRVKEFVNNCIQTPIEAIIAQYEQIQMAKPSKANAFIGMLPVNHNKNRYIDIYCLDNSRVILNRRGSDYIHANYVRHKVLQNDFILTQGPLPNTVNDFWQMVWQERSGLIFMLCKYVEDHKVKCADYLPTLHSRVIEHAGIRIELRERSTSKSGNIIMTQLLLSQEQANLTVMHYQWISWADHQVPSNDYKTPFYLLKKSRISPTCTVVHCSAGVGRSGTLVAIELCLMQLVAGNELVVPDMVAHIRRKRAHSVQTKEQYLYIFRALLDFAVSNHIICARRIDPFIEKYQQICAPDESHENHRDR